MKKCIYGSGAIFCPPELNIYNLELNASSFNDFDLNPAGGFKQQSAASLALKILPHLPSKTLFSGFLLIALILLVLSASVHAGLSATTAKTIQGTAPYIEVNGVKIADLNNLLSIKIGSDTYVSDAAGTIQEIGEGGALTPVTSITLATTGARFDSVDSLFPLDGNSHPIDDLAVIPLADRKDDDGDGPLMISGDLTGVWKDKNGIVVTNLTDSAMICNAPYTLTLSTTGSPEISSMSGDPSRTTYVNGEAVFTINPVRQPTICYAKPDMTWATGDYMGPVGMWDTTKGFIPQSTTAGTYYKNFPTTGMDGLYFDLDIAGSPSALVWQSASDGIVTAKTSNPTSTSVRVTLNGPKANMQAVGATAAPWLGGTTEFVLKGQDSTGRTVVEYGFQLKKWFVGGGMVMTRDDAASWCAGLSTGRYGLAAMSELTNAFAKDSTGGILPTMSPRNPTGANAPWRYIGGGLLAEWGQLYKTYGDITGVSLTSVWTNWGGAPTKVGAVLFVLGGMTWTAINNGDGPGQSSYASVPACVSR